MPHTTPSSALTKVDECKLAELFSRSSVIGDGGFNFRNKSPQVNCAPSFALNIRLPLFAVLIPVHAFEVTAAMLALFGISEILSLGRWANVLPKVVQPIAILVIVISGFCQACPIRHLMVHIDTTGFSLAARAIPFAPIGVPMHRVLAHGAYSGPTPLVQVFKITGGNDGKLSLCQRDQASNFVHSSGSSPARASNAAGSFIMDFRRPKGNA